MLAPLPKPEWVGDGAPRPGAGYVFSRLDISGRDRPVLAAEVNLRIDHTYSGDLQVHLITPAGEHVEVTRGASGNNDIRGTFKLDLPAPAPKSPRTLSRACHRSARGTWPSPITPASTSAASTRGR